MLALEAAPRSAPADMGLSYPRLGQAAHAFEALPATRVEHRSLLLQMSFAGSVVPRPLIRASFWQRFSFEASLSPVGGMSFSSPVFLRLPAPLGYKPMLVFRFGAGKATAGEASRRSVEPVKSGLGERGPGGRGTHPRTGQPGAAQTVPFTPRPVEVWTAQRRG